MRRIQKIAMFVLVVLSCAFLFTALAVWVGYVKYGFPRAWAGLGFMGIAGFGGFAPSLFKKDPGVECDERDRLIQRRAALAGFGTAYLVVGLATMGPFFVLGPGDEIGTFWLTMIFGAAGLSHMYCWSIAILIQYGWRGKDYE